MNQKLSSTSLVAILQDVMSALSNHSDEVQKLDAALGDGDMGVTLQLGSKAVSEYLASVDEKDIGKLLAGCGLCFNKASSSTFGTLLASAFMESGKACMGRQEIAIEDIMLIGQGAIDGIKKRGKAEIGEKTVLDPLVPAVEAFKDELSGKSDIGLAVESAIQAAKKGLEATIEMRAKHSRASWRTDGGVGVQDAGATAMYYLIEAFGRGILHAFSE
ncbi:MAG: DAK2 domain-containing protein [Dehalococcoidia bacterium]|nr:DAK2 domain-containing protein [Dehalococcoidia bacterium]